MPFGPYKNHADCVRKNRGKKTDVDAFCAWLKRKIEGADAYVTRYLSNAEALYGLWRLETLYLAFGLDLMTREKAEEALKKPEKVWRKDPDAVVLDDHRWLHVWAKTLQRGHNLFITKQQLTELHDSLVDELGRRGLDSGFRHESPMKFAVLLGGDLEELLKNRQPFLLDEAFINFIGSSVSGKESPNDVDVMFATSRSPGYGDRFVESLPENLRDGVDVIFEPSGPNGPYIPGYALWAIPVESPKPMEPQYHIHPMSPFPPASPTMFIDDIRAILEDSYFVLEAPGVRIMLHRKERQVIAYDSDLDEADIPDQVTKAVLAVEEPRTFILDGFLAREEGKPIFYMLDLPWWRDSEHIRQTAEERRFFLDKLGESDCLKRAPMQYFIDRQDTVDYVKDMDGPLVLIPGSTGYPVDGRADWYLYTHEGELKLAEGSDAQIRRLVDSGQWEGKSASERFSLMTKRRKVEALYPFAQLKTSKKGYSEREVFGLKSVAQLARELFRVPGKQAVEVKIDGFRVQAHKKGEQVKLFTESGHEITQQLPGIASDLKRAAAKEMVLDTECTPYGEDFSNLGRAAAAPAFAKGAKKPVDDSRWALHVFDVLLIDGEELHSKPYEERRKRLHGLEFPIRDVPKSSSDFKYRIWENTVNWATSAEQMTKLATQVTGVPGSEGAMFKQAESKYRLSGNTPLWSKMKAAFEIDALVVGVIKKGRTFNYIGAIGPVDGEGAEAAPIDSAKGKKFVKWKGRTYSILGKTFNTKIEAKVGDIIRVSMKQIRKIDDKVWHWFHPQVLEKREDKTTPDPLQTAETIGKTAGREQKKVGLACEICGKPASLYFGAGTFCRSCYDRRKKGISWDIVGGELKVIGGVRPEAYLINARYGIESPLASCRAPWIAIPHVENEVATWVYLTNDGEAIEKLTDMGIGLLIGTGMERELIESLVEGGMDFRLSGAETVMDVRGRPLFLGEPDMPEHAPIDPVELKAFLDANRSPEIPHMKTSCCASVPLRRIVYLQDFYRVYPEKPQRWSLQFHIRGLSVHGDFRITVSKSQAIGWTWNAGKSLIKPMLRRTPRQLRTKAGLTERDYKLSIKKLSAKLKTSKEGRKLMKALTKKTQDLSIDELKQMMNELWKEEMEPIIGNPSRKILTQKKAPMSPVWLDYEEEVPAGAVGATRELEGQLVIMDGGTVEFGTQKSYYHEYFIKGKRLAKHRLIIRRIATRKSWETKESFAWLTFFAKAKELPYVISRRAVTRDWMPPKGVSALPVSVREQIPENLRYWKMRNAKKVRNQLVDEIKARKVRLKLAAGLQFAVKRVWHRGAEVRRGLPVTRYWILLHDGSKIHDAFDFGRDANPLEDSGVTARKRDIAGLKDLLATTGEVGPGHPVSWTKKLKTSFDTSDTGKVKILEDDNNLLRLKFSGKALKGAYAFVRESGETWIMQKTELSEAKKAIFLESWQSNVCVIQDGRKVIRLSAEDLEIVEKDDHLLLIRGPAIKPGEVLPMDGKPTNFTKESIRKFWPSMYRQPVVILHGELKGDVIGFVAKNWFDDNTGWGWVEAVIWHPLGIKLILDRKLDAFSIEVVPQTLWDAEHQHDHVIDGDCIGLAVVPKGACPTCVPIDARQATIKVVPGKVYKFGMTLEQFVNDRYWRLRMSTTEIAEQEGIPRTTLEGWMKRAGQSRRSLSEARQLRIRKEEETLRFGGRVKITALGTGAFTDICQKGREGSPQCKEAKAGGKSKRNYTATLFSAGSENLLVNTPKGIAGMLGMKKVKPRYVLIEHIHEDVIGGLHELRPLKPVVFATSDAWAYLRRHYRALSKQKGEFEDLYSFPRYVIKPTQPFRVGPFAVEPVRVEHGKPGDPTALGFKIGIGDRTVWHCSDVYGIPNHEKVLKGVDVFIGDGASLTREIAQKRGGRTAYGHTSMEKQIKWAKEASIPRIYFTQIGHVGKTHEDLNEALKEMGGNIQALHDGMEIVLGGGNPAANHSKKTVDGLLSGEVTVIVRTKPYSEYAKQAMFFTDGEQIRGLYVEGFPDGPHSADKVKNMKEHGLSPREWERVVGNADQVWFYRPRVLKRFQPPRDFMETEVVGPYIHNLKVEP